MPASNLTPVTMMDIASRLGPDNKISSIIEMLAQTNEILADMPFVEGNLPTGHRTTIRTGLPSATWRKLNYGVVPSKSRTAQITDSCGMLEAYAEVDKALADLNNNTAAFRLSEDRAFLESMNQEMASTLFYGNENVDDAKFTGLTARFPAYSASETESGNNVLRMNSYTGTAPSGDDQASIWLVVWGENTVHGIYPKGSTAGLSHKDLGEQTLTDGQTPAGYYQGYRSHYKWDMGLTVRDWRYVVRIANIDLSSVTGDPATGDLFAAMADALDRVPSLSMGKPAFYMNRRVKGLIRKQSVNQSKGIITLSEVGGKPVESLWGVPFRRSDKLTNAEKFVS
jgi:hypothetical protein